MVPKVKLIPNAYTYMQKYTKIRTISTDVNRCLRNLTLRFITDKSWKNSKLNYSTISRSMKIDLLHQINIKYCNMILKY